MDDVEDEGGEKCATLEEFIWTRDSTPLLWLPIGGEIERPNVGGGRGVLESWRRWAVRV